MYTVLCIGDSITEGIGSSQQSLSYVSDLQVLLGKDYKVVKLGRNGATLTPALNESISNYMSFPNFEKAITKAKNAYESGSDILVSIMLGTNDADVYDYGYPVNAKEFIPLMHDIYISEYLYIINSILSVAPNTKFILCKSPCSYDNIKHKEFKNLPSVWCFQEEIFSICKKQNIPFTINDMSQPTSPEILRKEGVDRYFIDKLHPNDVGHMYFSHYFFKVLKKVINQVEL